MINMGYFLINSANIHPFKTALVHGERRISFLELNTRACKLANGLRKLGVKKGDRIAYVFPNCIELVETYFAIQKLGAVAVPLNHRLVHTEINLLLESAGCSVLFFNEKYRDIALREGGKPTKGLKHAICITENLLGQDVSYEALLSSGEYSEPDAGILPEDICRIQFTGGTTGIPKGVEHSHEQDVLTMLSLLVQTKIGTVPEEVVMAQSPMNHHGGYTWVMCAMAAGCTYVMQDKFDSCRILEAIEKEKVSYLLLLPPTSYLRLINDPCMKNYDVSSVKVVQTSAGGTSKEIAQKIFKAFINCEMHYGWAQTESGVGTKLILTRDMNPEDTIFKSVGRPAALAELKIVDDEGREVPDGTVGECLFRGPTMMTGYYGQPELTADVQRGGWLHTGDLFYRENGFYYMVGRKKDMIKSGGENVFASDVEKVLLSNPFVEECAVVGVPDEQWGEAIAAIIKPAEGCKPTFDDIISYCRCSMAGYIKPKYIRFVNEPLADGAGKIQKSKLMEKYKMLHISEE